MTQKIISHALFFVLGIALMAILGLRQPVKMEGIEDAIQQGISGINLEINQSSPDLSGLDKIKKSELHFTTIIQADKVSVTAKQEIDSIKPQKVFRFIPPTFKDTFDLQDTLPR